MDISSPPSFYELTFEPSKTYVEFKDWEPIFTLIEKAIQHLWRKILVLLMDQEKMKPRRKMTIIYVDIDILLMDRQWTQNLQQEHD